MGQPPDEPMPEFGPVPGAEDEGDAPLPWLSEQGGAPPPEVPSNAPPPIKLSAPTPAPVQAAKPPMVPPPKASPPAGPAAKPPPPAVPVPFYDDTGSAQGSAEAPPPAVRQPKLPCPRCGAQLRPGFGLCPNCLFEPKDGPLAAPVDPSDHAKANRPPEFTDRPEAIVAKRGNPLVFAAVGVAAAGLAWFQLRSRPPADVQSFGTDEDIRTTRPAPAPPPTVVAPSPPRASPFGEAPYEPQKPAVSAPPGPAGGGEVSVTAAPSGGGEEWTGWVFTGRVRDILTLSPVPKAKLKFQDFKSGTTRQAVTDKQGRFKVKLPTPEGDGYFVKIERPSYLDRFVLEGGEVGAQGPDERRERARIAARTVQSVPLSPVEEGRLKLDLLLVPDSVE